MVKYFIQYDETDCGAAALATALSILKNKVSLYEVKNRIHKSIYGSSIQDIIRVSNMFDVKAEGLNGNLTDLLNAISQKEIVFPLIAHIKKNEGLSHFVVVKKIIKNKVFIFDPAIGKTTLSIDSFEKQWTGNIIAFDNSKQIKKVYAKISIKQLFESVIPYKRNLIIISFIILLTSLLSIISAKSYQIIIDNFITNMQNKTITFYKLVTFNKETFFILIMCLFLIKNTLSYFATLLLNKTDTRLQKSLRFNFIEKFFSLPVPFIAMRKAGDSLTRIDDLENIGMFFSNILTKFLSDITMIFVGGIALISLDIQLFTIVLVIIALYAILSFTIVPSFYKKQRELMEYQAHTTSTFSESINSIELIKTSQLEKKFKKKLMDVSDRFVDAKKKFAILEGTFIYLASNVQEIGMFLIFWIGISKISVGTLTLGDLIAFQSLMGLFIIPMINLFSLPKEFQQFIVSFERVSEYEKASSEVYDYEEGKLNNFDLSLDKLSFKYGNKKIFENITLNIKEGEKVFIYGLNGSGKSTIFNVLDKINLNYEGSFIIGNHELETLPVNIVRDVVSYTPSKSIIFSGTVFENIIGNNDSYEPSLRILDEIVSHGILNNLFNNLSLGLDSMIYENGANLSDGQKQLISFCRTLVSKKEIMIFDEDTSHLDSDTEEKLLDFAFNNFKRHTFIFTSHNATIKKRCDKEFDINLNKVILL